MKLVIHIGMMNVRMQDVWLLELLQIQVFWDVMWFHWASKNDCEVLHIIHSNEKFFPRTGHEGPKEE
jgi:hypothetical protein